MEEQRRKLTDEEAKHINRMLPKLKEENEYLKKSSMHFKHMLEIGLDLDVYNRRAQLEQEEKKADNMIQLNENALKELTDQLENGVLPKEPQPEVKVDIGKEVEGIAGSIKAIQIELGDLNNRLKQLVEKEE